MTEHIPIERILKLEQNVPEGSPPRATAIAQPTDEQAATDELVPIKSNMSKYQSDCCKTDWCIVDGMGISCSAVTYLLILFAEFAVVGIISGPMFPNEAGAYIHTLLFTFLTVMATASHVRAMVTDPGAIPKGNFTEENVRRLGLGAGEVVVKCTRCDCIKQQRAHHCSTCARCIRKMDHHCPWVNNCVGAANQKYFILFTFYIMLMSMYSVALGLWYSFACSDRDWNGGSLFDEMKSFMSGGGHRRWDHEAAGRNASVVGGNRSVSTTAPSHLPEEKCAFLSSSATSIIIIFLIVEGLLFGMFTMIMCSTQIMSIIKDETGIEQLKKERPTERANSGDWRSRLSEAFGGEFSAQWFSPFTGVLAMKKGSRTDYASFDV